MFYWSFWCKFQYVSYRVFHGGKMIHKSSNKRIGIVQSDYHRHMKVSFLIFTKAISSQCLILCVCFVDRCLSFCPFFSWPLCCLSFDLLLLTTPLVTFLRKYMTNCRVQIFRWGVILYVQSVVCSIQSNMTDGGYLQLPSLLLLENWNLSLTNLFWYDIAISQNIYHEWVLFYFAICWFVKRTYIKMYIYNLVTATPFWNKTINLDSLYEWVTNN
jgi:hypothetical protein